EPTAVDVADRKGRQPDRRVAEAEPEQGGLGVVAHGKAPNRAASARAASRSSAWVTPTERPSLVMTRTTASPERTSVFITSGRSTSLPASAPPDSTNAATARSRASNTLGRRPQRLVETSS